MKKYFLLLFLSVIWISLTLSTLAAAPWNWADISDQVQYRHNRPVWAMAYAGGYWYFTDGQDLWNGGQVYRTDGNYVTNITLEVRNAGLSRVDDIVSDGQSVLFLQNVAPRNNRFEIVKYHNGSYTNLTTAVQNALTHDEGLVSIVGRNGEWLLTTSKGRLFTWYATNTTPSQVTLPTKLRDTLNSLQSSLNYCSFSIESYWCQIYTVPISGNSWLIAAAKSGYRYGTWIPLAAYRYTNGSFSDITDGVRSAIGEAYSIRAASNGNEALFINEPGLGAEPRAAFISGSSIRQISLSDWRNLGVPGGTTLPFSQKIIWTGTNWLLIGNKEYYELHMDGTLRYLSQAQDYFVTGAANGNGTILLGGAVSYNGLNAPSSPLTAKLVKLSSNYQPPTANTAYSTYGPRISTSGSPSNYSISNGQSFTYRVSATDQNGLDRIELFINGARVKICYSEYCEYQNIYYANGYQGRMVTFSARAWDRLGVVTESSSENLYVSGASNYSYVAPVVYSSWDRPPAIWSWTIPGHLSVLSGRAAYHVGAWDNDGISQIEIRVNDTVRRNCHFANQRGNVECTFDLTPYDYSTGSYVTLTARAIDAYGNVSWTDTRSLYVNPGQHQY